MRLLLERGVEESSSSATVWEDPLSDRSPLLSGRWEEEAGCRGKGSFRSVTDVFGETVMR